LAGCELTQAALLAKDANNDCRLSMHVNAAYRGSAPVVNQEESKLSNGKLPSCVHCQESDNGSSSSPKVVLDLMVLSIIIEETKFKLKKYNF